MTRGRSRRQHAQKAHSRDVFSEAVVVNIKCLDCGHRLFRLMLSTSDGNDGTEAAQYIADDLHPSWSEDHEEDGRTVRVQHVDTVSVKSMADGSWHSLTFMCLSCRRMTNEVLIADVESALRPLWRPRGHARADDLLC